MGVAASIVSIVLKSVVGDKLGNGLAKELIGISIDGVSEKGLDEITDFINGERTKIDSILSPKNMKSLGILEEKTDYVIVEIKDLLSKIDITDKVLRQCRYDSMNLSAFLWNKYCECKEGNIEYESEIKRCLFAVADKLIELVRESKNFEKDVLINISNSVDDASVGLQKISEYMDNNFGKLSADNRAILEILQIILKQNQEESTKNKNKKQKIKSRTQEYADKWEANMFLNDFDKRDENAGINVKLREVYSEEYLPHFIWKRNNKESDKLKELLSEYINEYQGKKMLLILGQPGIGKSTLITWITANFTDRRDNILIYQFASDLNNIDWNSICNNDDIADIILKELNLSYDILNGKTLIIDGFDEISIKSDRAEILNRFYWQLIKRSMLSNFSLIITCRENYIAMERNLSCAYITLQPWDDKQIQSFCIKYSQKVNYKISTITIVNILNNREILGIPLILYMVLALNISIEKEGSIVDVYDKIFLLNGGIYDRCINNDSYASPHWINEIKKQVHQISRNIAIWMFENNPNEAYIPHKEYEKICTNVIQEQLRGKKNIEQDFLIGTYFKLVKHCEGIETEKIYFVHRSIFEYFVAEAIYSSIENSMIELTEEAQEDLARNIAFYLKESEITYTIGEYLKRKILKLYYKLDASKRIIFCDWWEDAIVKMMKHGMLFYTKKPVQEYDDVIVKEAVCFRNLVYILNLLLDIYPSNRYILQNSNKEYLQKYVKIYSLIRKMFNVKERNRFSKLILRKFDLSMCDFSHTYLNDCDFTEANLSGTNFEKASLVNAILTGAIFIDTNLCGADMRMVNLENFDLQNTNLKDANLANAKLKGVTLGRNNLIDVDLTYAIFT